MPSFCVISNCQDKYKHSENISFHKFPHSRKDLLEKWIEFANREPDWKPSKWSAICSRHFAIDDFRNVNSRKTLKKTAIPTIKSTTWNDQSDEQLPPCLTLQNHEKDLKIPESNCRLCGICCRPVATFATNFEIFGMIQKCFPTLNIQLDDNLPKDMCSGCLKRLNSFSEFVDTVLNTQKHLHGTIRSEKFIKPPERQLKIKQEPVVNVKQEVAEHFDSFLSDELEEEQDCEQKFSFCDFPMLNTQDIINNCDIMEIINLDDPFIDIPDDENGNEIGDIVNPGLFTPKSLISSKLDSINLVHEHNYAMPIECKESINLTNVYKTEKMEDKDDHDVVASSLPPDTLITAKPKFSNNSESTIIGNDLQFSHNSSASSGGKLMVTSVSDLLPRPKVEANVKKPNIVVLNESIVKTASAFQLHPCCMCQSQFFSAEGLSHHVAKTHFPMVTLPPNNDSPSIPIPPSNDSPEQVIQEKVDAKSIICPTCSSCFSNIHDLIKHKNKTHSKLIGKRRKRGRECPCCLKFFISQMALKNHRNFVCLSKMNSCQKTFKCRWCSKDTFSHWRIYRNHASRCKKLKNSNKSKKINKVTKIVSKTKVPQKPSSNEIFNLLCLGCNKTFKSVDDFRLHYIEEKCKLQPSADQVLAFCRTCNRPITKFAKLRIHRHFQYSLKYFCKECPKEFKNSKLLAQHRITHSNVRKHKCQLCEKAFKRNCGLQQHIKAIHLKLKPHECGVCKRHFALKGDMLRCKHSVLTL
ncbi:zinc finger protein 473 [Episyrphus balteatus]|uniref:zinc finger protein 473 n=1 Tax=Episyrphus balteatus TaxID=286459 RepID=UPI002485321E|nr:zinc finger protein 473 [Episyrphus balteatus]